MNIEKVTIEDAQALLDIYSYYIENTAITFEYDVPTLEEFKSRISSISSKFPYIKAVEGNKILGYAYAASFRTRKAYDWCAETTIYLDKECRGKGLGKILYETLEKSLKNMGICTIVACVTYTETDDEHLTPASPRFHLKNGFNLIGVFHNSGYKFNKWYDMAYFEKKIGDYSSSQPPVSFGKWDI